METACGDVIAITSGNTQRSEVGHLLAKGSFDPDVQGHVRARTAHTHPGQSHDDRVPVDPDQLNVAAVGTQIRAHPIEYSFDAFFGHHGQLQGQGACHGRATGFRRMRRFFDGERQEARPGGNYSAQGGRMPLQDVLVLSSWNFSIR